MIRTSVLRNPLLKSALKKDVSNVKLVRCFTIVCRPNRKKLTLRNSEVGIIGVAVSKNAPLYRFYSDYPEHTLVTLPALSPTMEFGTIVSWEKKVGDKLNEGDLLAEIETDKATMGYETPQEGYLAKILVPAGTKNVPIGKLVCIIVEEEAHVAAFKDFVPAEEPKAAEAPAPSPPKAPEPVTSTPPPPTPPAPAASPPPLSPAPPPSKSGDRIYASPLAKRLASEQGISLEAIGKGSGLYGSITSQDLSRAPVKPMAREIRAGDSYVDIPLPNMRSAVAKRLIASKQLVPHYYLSLDVNADKILALKENFNKILEKDSIKISMNDFVIKACALSCKKVPEANSSWQETFIRQYSTVDVSIAVHTDYGLMSPVIFDADLKGLATISAEAKVLSNKAWEGKLQPSEYEGGTVSVSNVSSYGVSNFSAIINPPQVCILSVGALQEKLIEDRNVACGFRTSKVLPVTLSCDHRVLDGAVGAQWLAAFRQFMENPSTMLL